MSAPRLPPGSTLTTLRRQGKHLLRDVRSGDPEALSRVSTHLPNQRRNRIGWPGRDAFGLRDALLVLAREHGFASWPRLKADVLAAHDKERTTMEYFTFMHNNRDSAYSEGEMDRFLEMARESGLFRGGSGLGKRTTVGEKEVENLRDHIGGYMRFDADRYGDLVELLEQHPCVVGGGTVEVIEMPKS